VNAARNGVSVLAASGDNGAAGLKPDGTNFYRHSAVIWPSSDPLVTSVGGTQLHLDAEGNRIQADNVWNETFDPNIVGPEPVPVAAGGGVSSVFSRPAYQQGVSNIVGRHRGLADVALSAAVDGGVLVFIGVPGLPPGYYVVGGTSEATPEFAGVVAIAEHRRRVSHRRRPAPPFAGLIQLYASYTTSNAFRKSRSQPGSPAGPGPHSWRRGA
jgi:subtilase family serine protease